MIKDKSTPYIVRLVNCAFRAQMYILVTVIIWLLLLDVCGISYALPLEDHSLICVVSMYTPRHASRVQGPLDLSTDYVNCKFFEINLGYSSLRDISTNRQHRTAFLYMHNRHMAVVAACNVLIGPKVLAYIKKGL